MRGDVVLGVVLSVVLIAEGGKIQSSRRESEGEERTHTMSSGDKPADEVDWRDKKREYEERMARVKNAKLRLTCTICGAKAKLKCPCATTQYCSTACQRIDWRDRGHRTACKKIRDERAAEAARAEAPTPPPSPPPQVVYGPAPRSHADEVRARIAAEHEAARARREANPEPEPALGLVPRWGSSRCPICLEDWDVNEAHMFRVCCAQMICVSCHSKWRLHDGCPLCRQPHAKDGAEVLARIRRHVENDSPLATEYLGTLYRFGGHFGIVKNEKKAVKIFKRAVELGDVTSMVNLGEMYAKGDGVKPNRTKAMQLTRAAADTGDAEAQWSLGSMLRDDERHEEAFPLFKLSAEKNFAYAHLFLGKCYLVGRGVDADLDEAKRCFARAAANGDERGQHALNLIDAENLRREDYSPGARTTAPRDRSTRSPT